MKFVKFVVLVFVIIVVLVIVVLVCDQIQVFGLLIVLFYLMIVVEVFGENIDFLMLVVELGGLFVGLKKFCEGVGENIIDIVNVLCLIKELEIEVCKVVGVIDIMEVCIGYDGIVFVSDILGNDFQFIVFDWFNVLVVQVVVDGKVVVNFYIKWNQICVDLFDQDILVFVLGIKYGICEVFEEKVIYVGCKDLGVEEVFKVVMSEDDVDGVCMVLCIDGKLVDIDGDYIEMLVCIQLVKYGIGVFGLLFYENNIDKLKVGIFVGVIFLIELIVLGEYFVLCLLFFYVKKVYIGEIQGLKEFVEFFVLDEIVGFDGLLVVYGLVFDL